MSNFDERRLMALEKALNHVAPPGEKGYYRINVNTVRELIADLREWQQVAKDNADAIHRIEKRTIDCPTCGAKWLSYAMARACCP
jgi:hypothetical protein